MKKENENVEKKLFRELNEATPNDFASLLARCQKEDKRPEIVAETAREQEFAYANGQTSSSSTNVYKRKITAFIAAFLVIFAVALVILINRGVSPRRSAGYFIVDINPSLIINYDEEGKVREAEGLNKDGEVLLLDAEVVGKDYREALAVLFSSCVRLGYFSPGRDDNALLISARRSDGTSDDIMTRDGEEAFKKRFVETKMKGVVVAGLGDKAKDEEAKKYEIDGQKYALIERYEALGGVLERAEYQSISVRELYKGIVELEEEEDEEFLTKLKDKTNEARRDLIELAGEKIEDLIESVGDYIEEALEDDEEKRDAYEKELEKMERFAANIAEEKGNEQDVDSLVTSLIAYFESALDKEDSALFKIKLRTAITELTLLEQIFTSDAQQAARLELDAFATYKKRADRYGETNDGKWDEDDIREYQRAKEEETEESWYDLKSAWQRDRANDLDD